MQDFTDYSYQKAEQPERDGLDIQAHLEMGSLQSGLVFCKATQDSCE